MMYLLVKYEIVKSDQEALCVLLIMLEHFLDIVWWERKGIEYV